MTRILVILAALAAAVPSWASHACPDRIQYKGGHYLKNGDTYYFANGSLLLRSGTLYYPSGALLRRDNSVYYPNGSYLQRDNSIYYPSGAYLKRDNNYYYSNGSYLKRDNTFYYSNGMYARRDGKLYRPDGTTTPFPVTLSETIAEYGSIRAEVHSDRELLDVHFRDLMVNAEGVRLAALWDGTGFRRFEITLNTGIPGENVLVLVNGTQVTCQLDAGTSPSPTSFYVFGRAGSAQVTVNPGYDAARLRRAIEGILDTAPPTR